MKLPEETRGRPRKYTDAQVAAVKGWKSSKRLCRELDIPPWAFKYLRRVKHKTRLP